MALRYGGDAGQGVVGTIEGDRVALLASGANFPDALAAGPIAAAAHFPLLLTPPDRAGGVRHLDAGAAGGGRDPAGRR